MLSLKALSKESTPIALYKAKGGKKKYIFNTLNATTAEEEESDDELDYNNFNYNELLETEFFQGLNRKEKAIKLEQVKEMLEGGFMKKSKNHVKKEMEHTILIKNGTVELIPNPDKREILYICGPSGVGKSYFTNSYAEKYHKLYPDNKVYLFSKKNEDENFDDKKWIGRKPLDFFIICGWGKCITDKK